MFHYMPRREPQKWAASLDGGERCRCKRSAQFGITSFIVILGIQGLIEKWQNVFDEDFSRLV